jgi:hypothetical protein
VVWALLLQGFIQTGTKKKIIPAGLFCDQRCLLFISVDQHACATQYKNVQQP